MYDNYLFNVKRGSLRVWQSNYDNIDENNLHNFELITGANNESKAVFNVEEEGSLRLTNVHALAVVGSFAYTFSIVKSKGNLRIDSGVYKSYTGYKAVKASSGSVVINGGKYFTTHNNGKALSISVTDDSKTTAEINYGTFGSCYTAVVIYKNSEVTINGGDFYYKDTNNNKYQECAVYAENCNDIYFDDFDQIWNHKTVGDFKNPKKDTDAPYTIGNVRLEMFSKILSDDFEFESGDNVAVRIDVIPKEGYTFYSSVFGQLNGIDSYATIKNADGSRSIVFTMTITAPDEYKTQNIELSVAEPVAGVKSATTSTCTSGYAIPGIPLWTPADTTFKSGTQYTVKIPVTAEYEWGDTSTVTAKVNGKDAKFIAEYKGGKQYAYYVEYTFDATKDYMLGDVNNDGKISVTDATLCQSYLVGNVKLSDIQIAAADTDGDGKVSVSDVTLIRKYCADIITSF